MWGWTSKSTLHFISSCSSCNLLATSVQTDKRTAGNGSSINQTSIRTSSQSYTGHRPWDQKAGNWSLQYNARVCLCVCVPCTESSFHLSLLLVITPDRWSLKAGRSMAVREKSICPSSLLLWRLLLCLCTDSTVTEPLPVRLKQTKGFPSNTFISLLSACFTCVIIIAKLREKNGWGSTMTVN